MTCRKCFHGYITHAEAIAGVPGKAFSVVWFLKKAMLNATEEEKKSFGTGNKRLPARTDFAGLQNDKGLTCRK